jgi:hypothetical protein
MVPNSLGSELPSARLLAPSEKINISEEEISMRERSAMSGLGSQPKRTAESSLLAQPPEIASSIGTGLTK